MDVSGVGERLRTARETSGWSLDAIAATTHLPLRYLEALEAERFDELPGPTYVKGFLRVYASHLGLPAHELVQAALATHAEWTAAQVAPSADVSVRMAPLRRGASGTRAVTWGALALVVIGIVYFAFAPLLRYPHRLIPPGSVQSAPPHVGHVPAAARPIVPPGATSSSNAPSSLPSANDANGTSASGVPAPASGNPGTPSPRAAVQVPADGVAVLPAGPLASPGVPGTAAAPQLVRVAIVAMGQAWVRAVVDGRTVYDGVLATGDRKAWTGSREVIVSTTNAGAVEVDINGRSLGRLGNPNEVVERSFAPGQMAP